MLKTPISLLFSNCRRDAILALEPLGPVEHNLCQIHRLTEEMQDHRWMLNTP